MKLTFEDKIWLEELITRILDARFGEQQVIPTPVLSDIGELYSSQHLVDTMVANHPVNPSGKWWLRAIQNLPVRILFDDVDAAETEREMAILEVNKEAIEQTYGRRTSWGFSLGVVVKFPALDVDGSEIVGLACVPNVNMLDGVRRDYAIFKVDETVKNILFAAHTNDQTIKQEKQRRTGGH